MLHVPDVQMPADCLTKWLPGPKVQRSVDYMTGVRARPTPTADCAELDLTDLDSAIAHLGEATFLHGNLAPPTQVGGSVVGEVAKVGVTDS